MHNEEHPLAGQTVTLKNGTEYRLEDWWDHLTGKGWGYSDGNPAALNYAMRLAGTDLPWDDEVVYGKIGAFGYLIHVNEIDA